MRYPSYLAVGLLAASVAFAQEIPVGKADSKGAVA